MAHFTYELDEFRPWPALAVYVYGEAVITYNREGPDPDVGYRGGPYDIEVESITINGHRDGSETLAFDDPLYKAIESRLLASDCVVASCIEDHEEV